jgi:hypothetical protein
MKLIVTLVFSLFAIGLQSQPGFNHSYDMGGRAAGFCSIQVSGDTIVIFGVGLPQGQPAGMMFVRMDTMVRPSEMDVKIYPNPAQTVINIESKNSDTWDKILLYNASGQTVMALARTNSTQLDISHLPDGMYFIQLTKKGDSITRKIVKRR